MKRALPRLQKHEKIKPEAVEGGQAIDRSFLRNLAGKLADKPLEFNDELYEPIYDLPALGLDDPVPLLASRIDFAGHESINLFSGFRGAGKTTELFRLKHRLEQEGYIVIYVEALDYVNAAEPIDITQLLLAMAGAFSEEVEKLVGNGPLSENFWDRTWRFLNTDIVLKEITAKIGASTPEIGPFGGLKCGADLKFELQSPTAMRDRIQSALLARLHEFKSQVDKCFEDGVKVLRATRRTPTKVVLMFDQLEQLRGGAAREREVIDSVTRIFDTYSKLLLLPYVHLVVTVPPWLQFVMPNSGNLTLLSTVHLWNKGPLRERCEEAWAAFREMIRRRLGDDGMVRLFGPDPSQITDRLIDVCGGHFRDLLRLLYDTVLRADSLHSLPVTNETIDRVISSYRREFQQIPQDDAKWLWDIARVQATALPSADAEQLRRLTRFLDNHWVLYFVNGDAWYDIHPLIRDEVEKVLSAMDSVRP